jgi:hypothetical protein
MKMVHRSLSSHIEFMQIRNISPEGIVLDFYINKTHSEETNLNAISCLVIA